MPAQFKTLSHNLCFFSLNHCLLMLFKTYMLEIKKLHVTPKILVLHVRNKEKKIVEKQSDLISL